jgi:hypothetical protein
VTALGDCGGVGQAPCGVNCTAPFTVRNVATCDACGGNGETCCPSDNNNQDFCGTGYVCNNQGTCAPCGGTAQACCLGSVCLTGTCTNGTCH